MKRWDQTTVCANLGASHDNHLETVKKLIREIRVHPCVRESDVMDKIGRLEDQLLAMADAARLMCEVATNKYPIYGLQSWMMEGETPSMKHAYAVGVGREKLLMGLITNMQSEITSFFAEEPLRDSDWPQLAQLAGHLSEQFPAKTKLLFKALTFVYRLEPAIRDIKRLFMGVDAYKVDWAMHDMMGDIDDGTAIKMLRFFGRYKEPEPEVEVEKPMSKSRLKAEVQAQERIRKRAQQEEERRNKKMVKEQADAIRAAGNVIKLHP